MSLISSNKTGHKVKKIKQNIITICKCIVGKHSVLLSPTEVCLKGKSICYVTEWMLCLAKVLSSDH